jgi:hypothetical protein
MTVEIRNAMLTVLNRGECVDECGEVNCTLLAETTAYDMDHVEWLGDPDHVVWEVAVNVAEHWEAAR